MDFGVGEVRDADVPAASGADAAFAAPPRLLLAIQLPGFEPEPDGEDGADVGQPGHRRFLGGISAAEQPHPGRVSQHQAGPRPRPPVWA